MITYKESKIAAQEIQFTLSRTNEGSLKPQESFARLVSNRYLGEDGVLALGDTYINFSEVPVEIIGALDTALSNLYECLEHVAKLKAKAELQSGDLVVNGEVFVEETEEPVVEE